MYLFSSTPQMWILLATSVALAGVELVKARCSQPQTPDHATLVYERHINPPSSLPNGYTVQVVCDELFLLRGRGNGLMTCSNGRWSNTASCTGICNQVRYFKRGRITYSAGNTIARYSCESGYRLEGNRELRCMSDGTWSGERPYCREIPMCEKPELGEHLIQSKVAGRKREELWIVGTILQFSCDVNFSIANDHDAYIECTHTGWNDTVPSCVETQCFRPWQIESGETVIFSTAVGGTVTFTCGSGFELVGDSVLTCQGNGQWTGTIPFCYNDDLYGGAMPLKHEYGVDLYFLFDASDRIGYEDFERSKRFAKELIQKIGVTRSPNSLRVGAASFSDHAQINFHTVAFQSTDEVISQGINQIQFTGGGTNIDEAIRLVSEVMLPQSVQRHGSYKAVFIITDGNRREDGARVLEARTLEERGVEIYCLGIGRFALRDKVLQIGSQPYREHVFMLNDFLSITQLVNKVINQTEDFSECGVSENTVSRGRVVGGNDASPGAWPWQVFLNMRSGSQKYKCGGVLIDRYWVLTTAHCVLKEEFTITAMLGMTYLSRPPHQQIEVEEAIPHPGYDYDRIPLNYQNDIALLKLRESAVLNANVRLVCLPDKTRADKLIPHYPSGSRHIAILTGWGYNNTRQVGVVDDTAQHMARLQQLALPLKSREDCLQSLEGKPELDNFDDSMFCAGYIGSRFGGCQGDAGGPLVKKARRQRQRRWTLIGLTSWGRGCAAQKELDFFTNVPYFMDWITYTMNST